MRQRVFEGNKLVIASHNEGKIKEINDLLKPLKIDVLSAKDFNIIEPDENGISFEENALIKSTFSSKQSGFPSLSDDSGICFPDLNNSPGIYSARWAGKHKDFSIAMLKIYHGLKKLKKPVNKCFFICSLSLAWPDGFNVTVSGKVDGIFIWPPRGENGFGYDPVFCYGEDGKSAAELMPDEKNKMSHRAIAMNALAERLSTIDIFTT